MRILYKDIIEVVLIALSVSLICFGLLNYTKLSMETPVVYKSWSTNECVRMIEFRNGNEHSVECPSTLPSRYEVVWVE